MMSLDILFHLICIKFSRQYYSTIYIKCQNNKSSTHVTGIAPCFISSFVLYELSLVILPGIQNISFPCSNPKSTVINVPLFLLASTTKIPSDNALIILLRAGKCILSGFAFDSYSVITAPPFFIISL